MSNGLADRDCRPVRRDTPALDAAGADTLRRHLHNDWSIAPDGKSLARDFEFKDFAAALRFAVDIGAMADAEDHHPDLEIGWGRCRVVWTTHSVGGLSENDFICAAKVDALAG